MKLSELRSALREAKEIYIYVSVPTPAGEMRVRVMKTPLLEGLGEVYGSVRSTETGLTVFREGDDELGIVHLGLEEEGPQPSVDIFDDEPDLFGVDG